MRVLFRLNNEGKIVGVEEGTNKPDIIRKFYDVFEVRSGKILQYKGMVQNEPVWINCDDDYTITSATTQLRLLPSKEEKLGLGNLTPSTSLVFCCDMQERFRPAIKYFEEIVAVAGRVLKAAELLDVPVIVTEQYPRGLGNTVEELNLSDKCVKFEKTKFSMLVPNVKKHLQNFPQAKSVILFGIETHVCVQQTVLDLTSLGFDVHVIADATSSRSLSDRQLAFERFRQLGAFVTTCETVLLQWVADKLHEQFKPIQNLIKELPPDTGLATKSNM